ncbi:MAG: HEPN domain-containing protein [archaeon YNP-LCB-024-027]|nr:HEPN domain-containing protein [Candidatus Culexarchaeum yellowstonense]
MSYEKYRDWFEKAIDDFETATELFKVGKWSKVCFLSYQGWRGL